MSDNIWSNEFNPFQKFKVLCHYDRMRKIFTGDFDAPINIALDIIQGTEKEKRCGKGFNCNFCMSNWEEESSPAEIPKEILFQIPEFFHSWGVKSICLAGHHSDPTMYNHNDLIHFLRLCKQFNIHIGFVSNGAYFSPQLLEEIARTCKWTGFSINAGNASEHKKITGSDTWDKIIDNIKYLSEYIKQYRLDHSIGYKFLITDDNYRSILDAVKLAREIGVRHFQIRPCDLPRERSIRIDKEIVEKQIKEALTLEIPGKFEVFGIREKFTNDFQKKTPYKCVATPLGSTWMANGEIAICPDRRWSIHQENMSLGNFIREGLESIRRKWGGLDHLAMIAEANRRISECHRCTSLHWHILYRHTVERDDMDLTLI